MSVLVAMDVGGSGLRSMLSLDGVTEPARLADGARIDGAGLDVAALAAATRALLPTDITVDVLVFGARGIIMLADPADVWRQLASLGARQTVVCSDAVTSLIGAIGEVRPGAVVAAGTGAVTFGCDFVDHYRRVDGWGHVLGDRGSGAWIGLKALRALLFARDRPADSELISADLWSAASELLGPLEAWPRLAMTRTDAPALLASLAPTVTALATVDPLAARICREAGEQLAGSLLAAAAGLSDDAPLAWTGGLFDAAPVRAAFEAALAAAGRSAARPVGSSLDGALLLARAVSAGRTPSAHPPYLLTG